MGRFYFGQIVEAYMDDGRGKTKLRPSLILSDDRECDAGGPISVVMISKSPTLPCPAYHIKVHETTTRDPLTGLHYPCWAKCNIVRDIELRRILRSWGHMPDHLLDLIVVAYDKIDDDPDFDDWQ